MLCDRCGYDLYGSRSASCPECGAPQPAYPPIYEPTIGMRIRRSLRRPRRYGLYGHVTHAGVDLLVALICGGAAFVMSLALRRPDIVSASSPTGAVIAAEAASATRDALIVTAAAILAQILWRVRHRLMRYLPSARIAGFTFAGVASVAVVVMMTIVVVTVNSMTARRSRNLAASPSTPRTAATSTNRASNVRPRPSDPALDFSVLSTHEPLEVVCAPEKAMTVHSWAADDTAIQDARRIVQRWLNSQDVTDAANKWWHPWVPIQKRWRERRIESYEVLGAEVVRTFIGEREIDCRVMVTVRIKTPGPLLQQTRDVEVWLTGKDGGDLRIERMVELRDLP